MERGLMPSIGMLWRSDIVRWERDLKHLIIVAALLAAGPALAVPPIGPRAPEAATVKAYAAALEQNDFRAFRSLIADDAEIIDEAGGVVDVDDWLTTAAIEFASTRQARILSAFSAYAPLSDKPTRQFTFVMAFTRCHPRAAECFPRWRAETIMVTAGKISELRTMGIFDLRRSGPGVWTFYD
jgi:hypothetical protein